MSAAAASWPRLATVAFDDTCRLIPGQYAGAEPEHALGALADDDDDLQQLIQLAAATNSRLQAQEERHPGGLGRADVVFGIPFSKIINAAFTYPGQGARFHVAGGRGAWYSAIDAATCVDEVAHHRIQHLRETAAADEDAIAYRLFHADIHGQDFAWLDDGGPDSASCLDHASYGDGQRFGAHMRELGGGGIVYPSVRHPGGTCVAVLQPALVANVRRGALYLLTVADFTVARVVRIDD